MKVLKVLLIVDSVLIVGLGVLFCLNPRTMAFLSVAGILAGVNSIVTRYAFEVTNRTLRTGLVAVGAVVAVFSAVLTLGALGR